MKLKLKFLGPNVVGITTRTEPITIGHAISFEAELITDNLKLSQIQALWNMERTFNELTKGRMHLEIIEERIKTSTIDPKSRCYICKREFQEHDILSPDGSTRGCMGRLNLAFHWFEREP